LVPSDGSAVRSLDLQVMSSSGLTRSYGTFREQLRAGMADDHTAYLQRFLPLALAAEGHAGQFSHVRVVMRHVELLPGGVSFPEPAFLEQLELKP
jgi:hypothetical protein